MAVTITPLGFKKPDGNELIRGGDNVIADNADKAEEVIAAVRVRLGTAESAAVSQNARITSVESKITSSNSRVTAVESVNEGQDIRIASIESAAFVGGGLLMEDPADPGFYLVGGA